MLTISANMATVHQNLQVRCYFTTNGCKAVILLKDLQVHEKSCKYKYPNRLYGKAKQSLIHCDRQYAKQRRLKPLIDKLNTFCEENTEDKKDVLFFLLLSLLTEQNNTQKASAVEAIWKGLDNTFTTDQCLALRVDKLETKNQYKKEYDYLRQNTSVPILVTPKSLDDKEKEYMPPSSRWMIVDEESQKEIYHTPAKLVKSTRTIVEKSAGGTSFEPLDVLQDLAKGMPEIPRPNCAGVRWSYTDAIAKTLEELDVYISNSLSEKGLPREPDEPLLTTIKDGADGMGDISIHSERSERCLPDKAFRHSFVVLESALSNADEKVVLFREPEPNSVRVSRPVLTVIADENNKASMIPCMSGIEAERKYLEGKVLKVQIPGQGIYRSHRMQFFTSMVDEKLDRSQGGLAGAGSTYLCTLCEATRETAKSKLGSFSISRTESGITVAAEYARVNPEKLSADKMTEYCKGVKSRPLLLSEPCCRGIDATHADINLGNFFRKIIVREIATVSKWEETPDIKPMLEDASKRLDIHLRAKLGVAPQYFALPGNYAKLLFDPKNEEHFLSLIPDETHKENLASVLRMFQSLRSVYRATEPTTSPDAVNTYKNRAVEMGKLLILHFPYAPITNYLHKIVEHVQEIIDDPHGIHSVGALSSEGNEAGNKVFRKLRKSHARTSSPVQCLRDIMWLHWLYTSPKLRTLAAVHRNKQRCSNCHMLGHNWKTCEA